jgi:hypothetical protein
MRVHVSTDQILEPFLDEALVLAIEEVTYVACIYVGKDRWDPEAFSINNIGKGIFIPSFLLTI